MDLLIRSGGLNDASTGSRGLEFGGGGGAQGLGSFEAKPMPARPRWGARKCNWKLREG